MAVENQYEYAVRMKDIEKYFGNVMALKGVNFEVGPNEVVGLIGDNGAGKSTLIKIMTGVFPPTRGEMYIRNEKISFEDYDVKRAHKWGIETVYQDKSLGEKQELWRNFFIGRQILLSTTRLMNMVHLMSNIITLFCQEKNSSFLHRQDLKEKLQLPLNSVHAKTDLTPLNESRF